MDDDFSSDVIAILIACGENRSNGFVLHVILAHITCVMGNDDRLAFVTGKALRGKDIFRESKLPASASVWVGILEDTHRGNNRVVYKIPLLCEVGFIELYAIQASHSL